MSRWLVKPPLSEAASLAVNRTASNRSSRHSCPYGAWPLSQTEEGVRRCSENDPEQRIEWSMSLLKLVKMIPEQQAVGRDLSTTEVLKHKWADITVTWCIWRKHNIKWNTFQITAKQKFQNIKKYIVCPWKQPWKWNILFPNLKGLCNSKMKVCH